ncbi:MAG: universal stress protein [Acidimicrobiales bacterium]|jgi:nucleotide-binding universal stress UspA family protein
MFEKLVVALDASKHAGPVLSAAAELASKFESEVRVLHVVEMSIPARTGQGSHEEDSEAQKLLDDAVATLQSHGVAATSSLSSAPHGKVAGMISDEARQWGATAIITGTRGLSDLEGILVGSTTHKLLHLTQLPVLVVH